REPLQIIAYLFVLFSVSAKLTFYSLLIVPVAGFLIGRIAKKLKKKALKAQQSFGLMISYLDEALSGIKVIKAFNASEAIKSKYREENKRYTRTIKRMAARQQLASPISEFLSVTMVALIVLYGGNLILNGDDSEFSASSFIVYIAVFSQVVRPVRAIRSEEHTSELQSREKLVCRLLLEKKKIPPPCMTAYVRSCMISGLRYKHMKILPVIFSVQRNKHS